MILFGEFPPRDFAKQCEDTARQSFSLLEESLRIQRACQLTGQHSDVDIQEKYHTRWALMAARGWARLIIDRRRDLINDRPNCTTTAEAPLDEAQERSHFDNPTTHTRGAYQHGEAAQRTCFALYFFAHMT